MDLQGNRITWLGHATFRIETKDGATVIVDPWVMGNPMCPESEKQVKKATINRHARRDQIAAPDSTLRHVRRDLTGEEILTHRSEEVDHLRIFREEGFVLDSTGYHCDISRLKCSLLGPNPEANCAFNHRNKLLLRMLVSGGMRASLHSPIDHRALFAGYDAAANLVGDLFLGH